MCKAGYTGDGLDCRRKYSQTSRKRTILRQGNNEAVVPFVNGHCHFWDTSKVFDMLLRMFLF